MSTIVLRRRLIASVSTAFLFLVQFLTHFSSDSFRHEYNVFQLLLSLAFSYHIVSTHPPFKSLFLIHGTLGIFFSEIPWFYTEPSVYPWIWSYPWEPGEHHTNIQPSMVATPTEFSSSWQFGRILWAFSSPLLSTGPILCTKDIHSCAEIRLYWLSCSEDEIS